MSFFVILLNICRNDLIFLFVIYMFHDGAGSEIFSNKSLFHNCFQIPTQLTRTYHRHDMKALSHFFKDKLCKRSLPTHRIARDVLAGSILSFEKS